MADQIIRPWDLPNRESPNPSEKVPVDNGSTVGGSTIESIVLSGRPTASQVEAIAGTDPFKSMVPLTTKQAIDAQVPIIVSAAIDALSLGTASQASIGEFATAAQGSLAESAVQGIVEGSNITIDNSDPRNPIISSTGGVPDGNKGDITVSSSGASWLLNPITPQKLADEDAIGFRMAANVRGRVNFFDFLQETRSSATREQIMNGTFTGDLAVEWQAFRDELWNISDAGGRAYGFLPECTVFSSVAPNFAMDWLHLETQGNPEIRGTGSARGLTFDGTGLGQGGFGVRNMRIGPIVAGCTGNAQGVFIKHAHQSYFEGIRCRGATTTGIHVEGCVWSEFKDFVVSSRIYLPDGVGPGGGGGFLPGAWPLFGLNVTGAPGSQNSWCKFDLPIIEDTPTGILMTHALGNSFFGGGAEGCSNTGMSMGVSASLNKFYGLDFEANGTYDIYCEGSNNEFHGTDSPFDGVASFAGATCFGNKIFGGRWSTVNFSSATSLNSVFGMSVDTLNDQSIGINRNKFSAILSAGRWADDLLVPYTPIASSSSGAITSYSVNNAYYKQEGKIVRLHVDITISNNGTGAGSVNISIPFTSALYSTFSGQEIAISSKGLIGVAIAGSTQMTVRFADATYPGATGARLVIDGSYERS